MNREFFQALTHGGASYCLEPRDVPDDGAARRFWGALTHSGPSYTPAPVREVAAREEDRGRVERDLAEAFSRWKAATREAEASMKSMEAADGTEDRRVFFRACVEALERVAAIAEEELSPVLRASYKATHPFDFLNRRLRGRCLKLALECAEKSTRLASVLKEAEELVMAGDMAAEKSVRAAYVEFSSIPDHRMGHFSHLAGAA
ncbi:hypothetical protein ACFRMQ_20230 [Kitasatospora sp. NPDC056783]|uniref:hypothetical protein n=1 Tax=Kitasatospora sp. NPDC056783 TaxID=3345943 RepID=UPI0036BBDFF3